LYLPQQSCKGVVPRGLQSRKVGNRPPDGCVRCSAPIIPQGLVLANRCKSRLSPTLPPGGRQPTSLGTLQSSWFYWVLSCFPFSWELK